MTSRVSGNVTAVLGPTNTGKTHLAIERMCAHSSGIIGFPLRLLAREVYDRVVALKGPDKVALVTGEEKIVPPDARWFLCTAESMPDRDVAFVALDEAQLGADLERGHVFTDRLLHARGRDETMILGSEALKPMIRALVPDAEIVARPRFSTLTYAGAKKISRLPKRSAIVAFSAEEVYAVAEMLRRLRGGAAVVMGALSPRTRNAQVEMFQAGEVDYLVATDAIGMGLNMDVAHVAFAGLHKFDGRRRRRLTVAEMAQIAGRAGRHHRDGTFGALAEEGPEAFLPEEVLAIEEHRFPRLDHLYWRDGDPDLSSIDALIASLERKPEPGVLRAAPLATDLQVLKRLADEPWVRDRVRRPAMVARLWAACGIPDFRKVGIDPHARFASRVFGHLSEGLGHVPHQWFADEIARLDSMAGDVETLAGRLSAIRSWAYIAQRADWLADPKHWAERTREIEERLSDGLHASLTQRFVDKRTTALIRRIGADAGALPVTIGPEGEVLVEDHAIGRLEGFLARQAGRWRSQLEGYRQYMGWPGPQALPEVEAVGAWLDAHLPAAFRPGLMHGDYHIGNVMFAPDGPALAAIVDWELATLGDPLLDLGRLLAQWPEGGAPPPGGYRIAPHDGLPDMPEMIAHYAARTGRDLAPLRWHAVLASYKLGILLEGSHARAFAGKAPRETGETLHQTAIECLQRAAAWIEGGPFA